MVRRVIYFLLAANGVGFWWALIYSFGQQNNLGYDYYTVSLAVLAGFTWVAIAGIFSIPRKTGEPT